nr:pentatomicin [Plautia stali]
MMTLKIVLVVAIVAAAAVVDCRPTHCERWKGDKEYRCAKDNYRADSVTVRNRAGGTVSFKTGLWLSRCGHGGQNYGDHSYSLGPGGSQDVQFGEVGPGSCNEMFIYDCKINNRGANCLDAVNVQAN